VTNEKPDNQAAFDPERYWSDRLGQTFSLEGVGWLGLGEAFNRRLYQVRRHVFRRAIRGLVDPPRARVLDVGSGTGFYIDLWRELGAGEVTGSDLTGVAVERLRSRYPDVRFEQLDISAPELVLEGGYHAISAMDVLFHIVDDEGYARAIRNLAALLAPGGRLIFSEFLLHGETRRGEHETDRSLAEVEALLREAGLEVELRRPVFVLMNTPVDSDSGVLRRSWTGVNLLIRRGTGWGRAVGLTLYPLELVLTRVLREGPSTEIVVCRKIDPGRV
jgi:SAM-dependent methyltransferase